MAISVPVVVLPAGYARNINQVHPNFNAALNFRNVTKLSEQVTVADATVEALRRAFTMVTNGRPGPVLVEFPTDILRAEVPDALVAEYKTAPRLKSGPDPKSVSQIAEALVAAERPVIHAGQGVHYAKAWPQLKALAELLECPVMTTLRGKSAFPENHPLSLGSGGIGIGEHLWHFLQNCRHDLRHRLQLYPHQLWHRRCRRARRSSTRRSTPTRSTRTCRSIWPRSAMPG